jgi:hypothetical protein
LEAAQITRRGAMMLGGAVMLRPLLQSVALADSSRDYLPANLKLHGPICGASVHVEKYMNKALETVDFEVGATFWNQWSTVKTLFEVNPYLAFVRDDSDDPNMSTYPPQALSFQRSIVAVGLNMYSTVESLGEFANEVMIGMLAHECAHVLQFEQKCIVNLNVDPENEDPQLNESGPCLHNLQLFSGSRFALELHADFMAGWILARTKLLSANGFGGFAKFLYSLGDLFYETGGHHGSPRQRLNLMSAGWSFGSTGLIVSDYATAGAKRRKLKLINSSPTSAFKLGQLVVSDFIGGCTTDECWF